MREMLLATKSFHGTASPETVVTPNWRAADYLFPLEELTVVVT
jgi:hypothetical protein